MRVLVLGGTRFIGRALTARLLREGHEVHLVTRSAAHSELAPAAIVHAADKLLQALDQTLHPPA